MLLPDPHSLVDWLALMARPGFFQYVKSPYYLGGYEVTPGINLDITEGGLEWVRTLNLTHRTQGYTMQVIHPEDMHVLVGYAADVAASRYGVPGALV